MSNGTFPLCVDLDGTLTHTDLLAESLVLLLKRNPAYALLLVVWLLRGKSYLKEQVSKRVTIDIKLLPYNDRLLSFLRAERQRGRALYLCTASNDKCAKQIAAHFGFFNGVMASDAALNMRGNHKAEALISRFGDHGFDYCGNDRSDLPVWQHAHLAIVVGNRRIATAAQRVNDKIMFFYEARPPVKVVLKAMRVYQWCKNLLVFVPLLAAHRFNDRQAIVSALLAFVAFSLCASSVYLINDMLDLDADRRHVRKRARPFASGLLPIWFGVVLTCALIAATAVLATMLRAPFGLALFGYFVLTLAYSFALKRVMLIDVFSLAALYTARLVAGSAACGIPLSYWLILFSGLIFLSLAMVKRYAELTQSRKEGTPAAAGRGYLTQDLAILQTFGCAAGYTAVLVLALYMRSDEVRTMYRHEAGLWVLFWLTLFWISHVWMIAFRGQMDDDPILFAVKNKISLGVIVACVASVVLAS